MVSFCCGRHLVILLCAVTQGLCSVGCVPRRRPLCLFAARTGRIRVRHPERVPQPAFDGVVLAMPGGPRRPGSRMLARRVAATAGQRPRRRREAVRREREGAGSRVVQIALGAVGHKAGHLVVQGVRLEPGGLAAVQ